MTCAILQTELSIPPVDLLKRAFRSIKSLTDIDAYLMAKDAYGILVRNLSAEDASVLAGALAAEGVATEIVQENSLPSLPPVKFVRRLDCKPEALMVYDPLNRSFPVDWRHVTLIAAGNVTVIDFQTVKTERDVLRFNGPRGLRVEKETDLSRRERSKTQTLLEIIIGQGVLRYSADAQTFIFNGLDERKSTDRLQNFSLVIRDLIHYAPHAVLNRGAHDLREGADLFAYPTKNAFYEEITWIRWQMARPIA
jgi:hypothetical protein